MMKITTIFLNAILCLVLVQVNAQSISGTLPKHLFAEDAGTIVVIGVGVYAQIPVPIHKKAYDHLVKLLEPELKKAGINAPLFINYYDEINEGRAEKERADLAEQGIRNYLMLTVKTFPDEAKITSATGLDDYKKVWFYAMPFNGGSLYSIATKMTGSISGAESMETVMADIHKTRDANPDYFEPIFSEEAGEGEELSIATAGNQHKQLPTDLNKQGILFVKYNKGDRPFAESFNEKYEKYLQNDYPFKYKAVTAYEVDKYKKEGYKYRLKLTGPSVEKKIIYSGGPDYAKGQTAADTKTFYYYYYCLVDLETNDEYHGVTTGHQHELNAMKEFIKKVKKEYGVQK